MLQRIMLRRMGRYGGVLPLQVKEILQTVTNVFLYAPVIGKFKILRQHRHTQPSGTGDPGIAAG